MQSTPRYGATALALLVAIAAIAVTVPASAQTSTATEIDSCTDIEASGAYVLTEDLADSDAETCIEVRADDVTLNGDGHTIDGMGVEDSTGVLVDGFENVTVRDLTVTDWTVGITYRVDAAGTVTDLTATANGLGVSVDDSSEISLAESALDNNGAGARFSVSDGNTITDTTANDNDDYGLYFVDSSENDLRGVTANNNDGDGITLEESSSNTLVDSTVNDNERGIHVVRGDSLDNEIEDVTAVDNEEWAYESELDSFGDRDDSNVVSALDVGSATVSFAEGEIGVVGVENAPDDPEGVESVDEYVTVTDRVNNDDSEITIDVRYDESAVEDAGVSEDSLVIYRFVGDEWKEVSSSVDADENTVSATVDASGDLDEGLLGVFGRTDGDADENGDDNSDVVDVGTRDLAIDFGDVVIADLDLDGPGLPDEHVDERTYEVGGFDATIDGLSIAIGDTDYRLGQVTIAVEPFDVVFEDVTFGDGETT